MDIKEQLQQDFNNTIEIEEILITDLEKYIQLSKNIDIFVNDHLDASSRTSVEKQIAAMRAETDSFNEDYLELNLLKNKIDLLKNKLSVITSRQRLADTIYRYSNNQNTSNLIEG